MYYKPTDNKLYLHYNSANPWIQKEKIVSPMDYYLDAK